jgi:hypothetical protein
MSEYPALVPRSTSATLGSIGGNAHTAAGHVSVGRQVYVFSHRNALQSTGIVEKVSQEVSPEQLSKKRGMGTKTSARERSRSSLYESVFLCLFVYCDESATQSGAKSFLAACCSMM